MFWSSMFRTEMPMTSGRKSWMEFLVPNIGSPSNIRFSKDTSLPAFRVAAATQASPRGRVGMLIVSVLAEISRTLTNSPRPPIVPSVVPDFHFGIPPGYECTLQSLVLKNGSRMHRRLHCSTSFHLLVAPRRFFLLCVVSPCPPWSEESRRRGITERLSVLRVKA